MPSLTAVFVTDTLFLVSLFYSGYLGGHLPAIVLLILATQFHESKLAVNAETWMASPRWLVITTLVWAAAQLVLILVFTFAAGLSEVFLDWMNPRRAELEACGIYVPDVSGWYDFSLSFFPTLVLLIVGIVEVVLLHGSVKFHTLLGDDDDGIVRHSSVNFLASQRSSSANLQQQRHHRHHRHHDHNKRNNQHNGGDDEDDDDFDAIATPNGSFGNDDSRLHPQLSVEVSEMLELESIKANPPVTGVALQLVWAALCALSAVVAPSYLGFPLFFLYIVIVGLAVLAPHRGSGGGGRGGDSHSKVRAAAYASLLYSSCLAALVMGAQNSLSKSTSSDEVGLVSWREELRIGSYAGFNIVSSLFIVLTAIVSRSLLYTMPRSNNDNNSSSQQQSQEGVRERSSSSLAPGGSAVSFSQMSSFAAPSAVSGSGGGHNHIHGGGGDDETEAANAAMDWLLSDNDSTGGKVTVWLVDFLLSNGPLWIFPIFVITCVSSPTVLSIVLLVVVFVASLNFKLFTHYAPAFYFLCSFLSISVYFVNIFSSVPTAVKIIIANRARDGAALPLIFQGAASGFAAISYVFFRFAEFVGRDCDRRNNVKTKAAMSKLKSVYWPLEDEPVDHLECELETRVVDAMADLAQKCPPTVEGQRDYMLRLAQRVVPCLTAQEFDDELNPLLLVASGAENIIVVEREEVTVTAAPSQPLPENEQQVSVLVAAPHSSARTASEIAATTAPAAEPSDDSGGGGGGGVTAPPPSLANFNSSTTGDGVAPSQQHSSTTTLTTTKTVVSRRGRGSSFVDPLPILSISGGGDDDDDVDASNNNNNNNNNNAFSQQQQQQSRRNDNDDVELLDRANDTKNNNTLSNTTNNSIYRQSAVRYFLTFMTLEASKRKLVVEVFISLFMYIMRYGTYAVCVLLVFAVATCQAEIDCFHLPLVIFTILAIQSRSMTLYVWPVLVVYLMVLSVWRFALSALDAGDFLKDWQTAMGRRTQSLLGIYSSEAALLYLYIATALLSVAEWRMQRNREVSLEQWLSRRYDARLLADPRVVRFYRIIGLGCLMIVLGYRAVWERSILFLMIMVLFFVLSGLITFTNVKLTMLWAIGMVMACIILLLEASVQIAVAAYPDYAWNAECDPGTLCAKDMGLKPATSNFELTGRLLPSFLSVVLFSAMRAWSEEDPSASLSSSSSPADATPPAPAPAPTPPTASAAAVAPDAAASAGSGSAAGDQSQQMSSSIISNSSVSSSSREQQLPRQNSSSSHGNNAAGGGGGEETQFTSFLFDKIFTFTLGFLNLAERLLLANLRFVVWGSQLLAAVLNPGVMSFTFGMFFIFDVRGFALTVFSGLNMLVIYLFRFSLVSGKFTDYTRDCFQFVGWIIPRNAGSGTWRLLLGPMLCFVSSLCYENLRRFTREHHQRQQHDHHDNVGPDENDRLDAPLLNDRDDAAADNQKNSVASSTTAFSESASGTATANPPPPQQQQQMAANKNKSKKKSSPAAGGGGGGGDTNYQRFDSDNDDDGGDSSSSAAVVFMREGNNNSSSFRSAGGAAAPAAASTSTENNNVNNSSMHREPEALSGFAVLVRDFAHNCSYELLLLTHLIGSAVCIQHVTGLMHVMQVTLISLIGRVTVTTNMSVCMVLRIFESVLFLAQCTVALEPVLRTLILRDNDPPNAWLKYLGIGEAQALSIWSAVSLIVLRLIKQLERTSTKSFNASRAASGGFATLQEMLHKRNDVQLKLDDTVAETDAHEQLLNQLLDGSDKPEPSGPFARRLIHISTYVLPTAVLTFFDGLGHVSMLNALIIFSGLVMLSNQRRIHWRNHILWNRWIWFCDLIPWIASVCNLPPVADYIVQHRIFSVVGFRRDNTPMTLSPLRVLLFWSAHLQRRIFEEFDFAAYLREIHSSRLTDAEQHRDMAERIQRKELTELTVAKRQNRERQRRLEEIRKARFEIMSPMLSPQMKVFEEKDETTTTMTATATGTAAEHKKNKDNNVDKPPSFEAANAADSGGGGADGNETEQAEKKKESGNGSGDDSSSSSDDDGSIDDDWVAIDATTAALQSSLAANIGWREKLGAVVDAVTAQLCNMSVHDFTKVQAMYPDSRTSQLFYAIRMVIETHTAHMVLVLQLVNCAVSGTIFDALLPVVGLAVAFVRSPWPPTWYWRLCITFSMISVVVKTSLSLLASEVTLLPQAKHWLRVIIFEVPEDVQTGGATSGSLFIDLGLDFAILFFVLVHRYQSRRLGLSDECFSLSSAQANSALQKTFFENLTSRFGVGIDLYSLSVAFDGISFVIVLFGYYSLFPDDSASSVLDSFKSNLLPGPLVVALLGILATVCIDRVVYLMQATRAKFVLHVLVVLAVHGVYIWWRSIGMASAAGTLLLLMKQFQAWLAATQLRRGYPLMRRHDPFSTRPGPPFYWLYYVYRGIPFLFEMRTLLDWTFTRTALPCHYWVKLEDIAHEVYLRNIDRYDHKQTNPTAGFATKFIWKLLFGFLVFVGLFATMVFPLMYYSTFNPSLQDNTLEETEVQCMFGPISTYFRGRIASRVKSNQVPTQQSIVSVRPAFQAAQRSSGSTVELFNIARCSTFNWQISPPALRYLNERLRQTAYPTAEATTTTTSSTTTTTTTTTATATTAPGPSSSSTTNSSNSTNNSNNQTSSIPPTTTTTTTTSSNNQQHRRHIQRHPPLNFRNVINIKRKGSVSPEGKKASFVRDLPITQEQARALLNLTDGSSYGGGADGYNNLDNGTTVMLTRVHADDFWLPIISSDPNTATLFEKISIECHLEFYATIDPRTGVPAQYSCISCAPLFSLGNTPNKSYDEYTKFKDCLGQDDLRRRSCPNYDVNETHVHIAPQNLYFYAVNERVPTESSFLPNVGIVALYTTFVLVIWRFVRGLFAGMAYRVTLEDMQDPDKVKELVDLIYLSRESNRSDALLLEEALYFELLDLLRGPDGLLKVTGQRSQGIHSE